MSSPREFVEALRKVGCEADGPWDLVSRKTAYRSAVPVLIEWLGRVDDDIPAAERRQFREGLVRALAVREARGTAAVPALIREFQNPKVDPITRWAVANSLSVVADASVFDELVELARDRSYGKSREMLMLALVRSDPEGAAGVLIEMLNDDEVVGHVIEALGKLGNSEALPSIERFLDHQKPWVRREANKALKKLRT